MKNNNQLLPSPAFICEEKKLIKNLELLKYVQDESDVSILLALKAYSLKSTFDLCRQYLSGCCASGLNEAKLAKQEFRKEVHTYSPAYKPEEFEEISNISNHIVFNSFSQLELYQDKTKQNNSLGLRINPEFSSVGIDLYNPCSIHSRLGITKKEFDNYLQGNSHALEKIEGFHFHALCEQNFDALENVFAQFEHNFSTHFKNLKWLNFGGGHHITKENYEVGKLIIFLQNIRKKYPHLKLYLEPGEAIGWETGYLSARVLDILHNKIDIAILDASAECHMPDTLAMPYKAKVRNASSNENLKSHKYQLAGNTCLAGDIIGNYSFDNKLEVGDEIIFEDMIHYTMVKTTTFNGVNLPSIILKKPDGTMNIISSFGYNDFVSRI
jgi:carboxynorspermidine decarboxylase